MILRYGTILLLLVVCVVPRIWFITSLKNIFPAHKKQVALQEIFNFVQTKGEGLPQACGKLCQLLKALPDHPLKKNEILDIFYNGLTDASRDFLDSCAGCFLGNELLGKLKNYWIIYWKIMMIGHFLNHPLNPLRRRGVFYISVLKICKRQRNLWRKKVLKLRMSEIYLLLKKYIGLIHHHCLRW